MDVGGSKLRAVISDSVGRALAAVSEHTTTDNDVNALSQQIAELLDKALCNTDGRSLKRICVATTGPLSRKGGVVNPANLPPRGFIPIVGPLQDKFGSEVVLVNDCSAAAVAEKETEGRGAENLVYLTLSTGIGAGVIVDGHLLMGKDGNAHEVGHMVVDPQGNLRCGCGGWGHWEAYCSGKNIPRYAKFIAEGLERSKQTRSPLHELYMRNPSSFTTRRILGAARRGDPLARLILDRVGVMNAMGLSNIVDVYDPEIVYVGGAVALNHSELILRPMLKRLKGLARNRLPLIRLTGLGDGAAVKGAAIIARSATRWTEIRPWIFQPKNVT